MSKKERRDVFYAWHHKETGERLGWVFPSRRAAKAWMEENYWRYPKYGRVDDYLETLRSVPVMKFSRKYWYRDRDIRENYEMLMGVLTYPKLIAGRMAPFEITYLTAKAGTKRKLNGDSRGRKTKKDFGDVPGHLEDEGFVSVVAERKSAKVKLDETSSEDQVYAEEQEEDS